MLCRAFSCCVHRAFVHATGPTRVHTLQTSRTPPVILMGSTEGFRLRAAGKRWLNSVPCAGGHGVSNAALRSRRRRGSSWWWRLGRGVTACLACRCVAPARSSWIDPDTLPEDRQKTFESDGRDFDLVFSDEFNRYYCCMLPCEGSAHNVGTCVVYLLASCCCGMNSAES